MPTLHVKNLSVFPQFCSVFWYPWLLSCMFPVCSSLPYHPAECFVCFCCFLLPAALLSFSLSSFNKGVPRPTRIFNRSLQLCHVTLLFNHSTIIPIPKRSTITGTFDYRFVDCIDICGYEILWTTTAPAVCSCSTEETPLWLVFYKMVVSVCTNERWKTGTHNNVKLVPSIFRFTSRVRKWLEKFSQETIPPWTQPLPASSLW